VLCDSQFIGPGELVAQFLNEHRKKGMAGTPGTGTGHLFSAD
jgi:hypothetical protein